MKKGKVKPCLVILTFDDCEGLSSLLTLILTNPIFCDLTLSPRKYIVVLTLDVGNDGQRKTEPDYRAVNTDLMQDFCSRGREA